MTLGPAFKYRVANGYHRYYASAALGFRNVPIELPTEGRATTDDSELEGQALAQALLFDAQAFLRAADKASKGDAPAESIAMRMPINALLGHACELALKSLLAQAGWTAQQMRRGIGHDLDKALDACVAAGLQLDQNFVDYYRFNADAHRSHWFRYPGNSVPWIGYADAIDMIRKQLLASQTSAAPHLDKKTRTGG